MISFLQRVATAWRRPSGYREVLHISLPLIISMSSHTVMLFTDRLFLGRYSLDTLAASVPAGLLAFMFMCFFMGVVEFTNTFVAQYVGAHLPRRVGSALWQGIYLALAAGILLAGLSCIGASLFRLAGHAPRIQELETVYFRILMLGAGFGLLQNALSCFYSGRGLTMPIMVINVIGVTLNVPLNYLLINGGWGLPALGMSGSALATVASAAQRNQNSAQGAITLVTAARCSTGSIFGMLGVCTKLKYQSRPIHITPEMTCSQRMTNAPQAWS